MLWPRDFLDRLLKSDGKGSALVAEFNTQFHSDLNLIEVKPVGVVQTEDILSYAREALADGQVREGTIEYYDLSEMTDLQMSYSSIHRLRETLQEWLDRGWEGGVFFAPRDEQFGMIRMLGAVTEAMPGAGVVVPCREPVELDAVREFLAESVT